MDGLKVRATASTSMNMTSSRSHALFVVRMKQTRKVRVGRVGAGIYDMYICYLLSNL